MDISLVKCMLCEKEFRAISNTHLKHHGITVSQYKIQFPNSLVYSESTLQKCAEGGKIALTQEQRSANGKLSAKLRDPEKHRQSVTKGWAKISPEMRKKRMQGAINWLKRHPEGSRKALAIGRKVWDEMKLQNPSLTSIPKTWEINSEEKRVLNLVEPYGFKYVGNKYTVDGLRPDFINEEKKLLIEYNGCYWHGCRRCFPKGPIPETKDDKRIERFVKHGYKVLMLTTHNMNDIGWDPEIFKHFIKLLEHPDRKDYLII